MQVTGNQNGKCMENAIESILRTKKYHKFNMRDLIANPDFNDAIYVPQYRKFTSIYGKELRLDFFVVHPKRWPEGLAIECKWQSSTGTVDEKYPYVVASFLALPCPAAIFIAGGGYNDRARDWILGQESDRLIVIEGMDRIMRWANAQL